MLVSMKFNVSSALQHMITHRPRNLQCPFTNKCGATFSSRSALLSHLESGSCKSGANRTMIAKFVIQYDKTHIVTNPTRLLTYEPQNAVTYIASERAWNGWAYECYFCHRDFGSLPQLNTHLASPRHAEKIYRCPLPSCLHSSSLLSALVQHIESQKCGVSRFHAVQQTMDGIFNKMEQLTMGNR